MRNDAWWGFYRIRKILVGGASLFFTAAVLGNPVLDNVASGNVSIQQAPGVETINQSSHNAILDWQSFDINKGQATHFIQPTGGIALNHINPMLGPAQIYGELTATGRIILVNPAGIYFGPSAYVNVGGMIATTANIKDSDFLSGNYQFLDNSGMEGSVINQGTLIAASHGLVALVGSDVTNNGLIKADMGNVVLASGDAYTMSFDGNDLVNFAITKASQKPNVTNNGALIANGGQVLVTAAAAAGTLDNTINMNGVAVAHSIGTQTGDIVIEGATGGGVVNVSGRLDASGKLAGEIGGNVAITGYDIALNNSAVIDVSGDQGGGNINVGGSAHGAGPLPNANAVTVAPNVNLYANALTNGNGGNVVIWSENGTQFYGNIFSQGGALSGNGGNVEVSGLASLFYNGMVNALAPHGNAGSLLLDPDDITVSNTGGSAYSSSTDSSFSNTSDVTILATGAGSISAQLANVILAANDDITFSDAIDNTNSGVGLTAEAGNSIAVNAGITLTNGALVLDANDSGATGADRGAGAGGITFASDVTLNTGTGNLTLDIGSDSTSPFSPGSISFASGDDLYSSGNVTLTTDSYGATAPAQIGGTSATTYAANVIMNEATSGNSIGVAGGAGTDQFTSAIVNTINADDVRFGDSNAGTVTVGTSGNPWAIPTNVADNGVLSLDAQSAIDAYIDFSTNTGLLLRTASSGTDTVTMQSPISAFPQNTPGPGDFAATLGSGSTLTLNGGNSQFGNDITISSLTDDLGTVSGITIPAGTLSINQDNPTTNDPGLFINEPINLSTGSLDIDSTLSAIENPSGGISFGPSGSVTANSLTVSPGFITLSAADQLGSTTNLTDDGYVALGGNLTLNSLAGDGVFYLNGNTLTIDGSATTTFNGYITGNGTDSDAGNVVLEGGGSLTLGGDDQWSGTTTLDAGTTLLIDYDLNATTLGDTFDLNGGTIGSSIAPSMFGGLYTASPNSQTFEVTANSTIGGTNDFAIYGAISLGSDTTLTITNPALTTLEGGNNDNPITGAGNITLNDGTLYLSAYGGSGQPNTFSGTTTINNGTTLDTGGAGALGTGPLVFNGTSIWNDDGGNSSTIANAITLNNNANTTLSNNGTSSSITLTGPLILDMGSTFTSEEGSSDGVGALILDNSVSGTGSFDVDSGSLTSEVTQAFSGTINLSGGNLIADAATNPFGTATINWTGGNFNFPVTTAIANTINVESSPSTEPADSVNVTFNGPISIANGDTWFFAPESGYSFIFNGALSGAGTLDAGYYGNSGIPGFAYFNADSSDFTGTIDSTDNVILDNATDPVGTGIFQYDNNGGNLPTFYMENIYNGTTTLGNSQLDLTGSIIGSGSITLTGILDSMPYGGTGSTNNLEDTGTLTIEGGVSGGDLTQTAGTVVLPVAASSWVGPYYLSGGTLEVGNNNSLGNSSGDSVLYMAGGTLLSTTPVTIPSYVDVTANSTIGGSNNITFTPNIDNDFTINNGDTLTITNTGTTTINETIYGGGGGTGPGNITINAGTGSFWIGGIYGNYYSGTTDLDSGTLVLNIGTDPIGTSTLNFNGGTLQANLPVTLANSFNVNDTSYLKGSNSMTFSGSTGTIANNQSLINDNSLTTIDDAISGLGGITENAGELVLTNTNTYGGGTDITGGILDITSSNALGSGAAIVSDGGTLELTGSSLTLTNPLVLDNGGILEDNSTGPNTNTIAGGITLDNTASSNETFTVLNSGENLNIATDPITGGAATTSFTVTGAGTLTFSAPNNTYSGATDISGGTLNLANGSALGNTNAVDVTNDGTLDIDAVNIANTSVITLDNGTLAGTGNVSIGNSINLVSGSTDTLASNTLGDTVTIQGDVNGAVTLALTGPGGFSISNVGDTNAPLSFTANAPLTLSGLEVITTGNQTYNDPLLLTGTFSDFNSTNGGAIDFASTVNGNSEMSTTTTGTTTFGGVVGGNTELNSLTVSGPAAINTTAISTSNDQDYENSTTLGSDTTLTANSLALNAVNGDFNLTTDTSTNINQISNFDGNIDVGGLTVNGTSQFNDSTVQTTGAGGQIYNGEIAFDDPVQLLSGSAPITFNNSVSGSTITLQNASNTSTGTVSFLGGLGVNNLATFAAPYAVQILNDTATFDGAQTFLNTGGVTLGNSTSMAINFSGGLNTSAANVVTTIDAFLDDINSNAGFVLGTTLIGGSPVMIDSDNNPVSLGKTDGVTLDADGLGVNAGTGAVTLTQAIGSSVPLLSLDINSSGTGTLSLPTNITTGGVENEIAINNGGPISQTGGVLNADFMIANSVGGLSLPDDNIISEFQAADTGSGNISLQDTVPLSILGITTTGNVTLDSTSSIAEFAAIDGALLTTSSVGGTSLGMNFVDNGVSSFNGTNSGSGDLDFTNTTNANTLTITGISQSGTGAVNITNTGPMTVSGAINSQSGDVNLTTDNYGSGSSASTLTVNNNITTTGGSIDLDAANITPPYVNAGTAEALVINAGSTLGTGSGTGGVLTFEGGTNNQGILEVGAGSIILNGNGLDITQGAGTFDSSVSFLAPRFVYIDGPLVSDAGDNIILQGDSTGSGLGGVYVTGSVASGGDLTIEGVSLAGATGSADGNAGIDLAGPVSATGSVTLTEPSGSGNIDVDSVTGDGVSITTAGTGIIKLNNSIDSTGTVQLNSPVDINAALTITGDGAITFGNTVNGSDDLTLSDTATSGGLVTFDGDVTLPTLLTSSQPYAIDLDGSDNTFSQLVTFLNTGDLQLGTYYSNAENFNGGLNTASAGTIILNGSFADTGTNAGYVLGSTVINSDHLIGITTNNDPISLGVTNGETADVDALILNPGSGAVSLNGNIGDSVPLSGIQINGANYTGTLALAHDITVSGSVFLFNGGPITQSGAGIITASQLNETAVDGITMDNTNDIHNLTLTNTGSGSISFEDSSPLLTLLGTSTPGDIFLENSGGELADGGGVSGNALTAEASDGIIFESLNPIAISSFNATDSSNLGIILENTIPLTITGITETGSGPVDISTNGAMTVSGAIASTGGGVDLTATGGTIGLGAKVSSGGGPIQFNAPVNVNANEDVDAGNGTINFADAVSGANTLSLQDGTSANGTVTFDGDVTLPNLGTFGQPYAIIFNGGATFSSAVNFLNSAITLGNDALYDFEGGLTHTVTGTTTLDGSVETTNQPIDLGSVALTGDSSLDSGNSSTALGALSGAFNLDSTSGMGTILDGAVDIGSFTLNGGGTDILNNASITTSGDQTYDDALTLNVTPTFTGNVMTFNGAVNGVGGIDAAGGTLILANSNNGYHGGTTITSGILELGANNAIPSGTSLTVPAYTTFDLGNFTQTLAGLSGFGDVTVGTNLTIDAIVPDTFGGDISGTGGLTLDGSSTFTLDGDNSYNGTTYINNGTLTISSNDGLSSSSPVAINGATLSLDNVSPTTAGITMDNGTINGIGNVTLATPSINFTTGTSDAFSTATGAVFNINGDLNGDVTLALNSGNGTLNINGNIGNTSPLASLTTSGNNLSITGNISTIGSQTYGANVNLSNNVTYSSETGGAISFDGTVNGNQSLNIASGGVLTFNGAVGNNALLSSLILAASNIDLKGGSISTSGAQNYNSPVTLTGTETLTGTAMNLNNGINGGSDLNLNGTAMSVAGTLGLADITVTGQGANNSLALNSSAVQDWAINSAGAGSITAISGVGGAFTFSNLQSLIGGAGNDNFSLAGGGSLAGSINGGGGTNSLTGGNAANTWSITGNNAGDVTGLGTGFSNIQNLTGGNSSNMFMIAGGSLSGNLNGGTSGNNTLVGDNIPDTWTITGDDTGNVTSVSSFNNIQNLTGGNAGNTFNFANDAMISGLVNGGSPTANNEINWSANTGTVTAKLTSNQYAGTAYVGGNAITNYTNVNFIVGNDGLLSISKAQYALLTRSGPFSGTIADPLMFSGFFVPGGVVVTPGSPNSFLPVYPIIQQPDLSYDTPVDLYGLNYDVDNNISNNEDVIDYIYNEALQKVHINPYCGLGGTGNL